MTLPVNALLDALRALNDAAYAAIRAGRDTVAHPDLDRQTLREIARATDKLVEDQAPAPRAEPDPDLRREDRDEFRRLERAEAEVCEHVTRMQQL